MTSSGETPCRRPRSIAAGRFGDSTGEVRCCRLGAPPVGGIPGRVHARWRLKQHPNPSKMDAQEEVTPVVLNTEQKETAEAIARGVGEELRHRREAQGESRAQFVKRLPSGIGDRTLLAYEHGLRQLTVIRLVELSEGLGVGAPIVLGMGLQRAEVTLQDIPLRVDLSQLLDNTNAKVRPLHQWAKNRMRDSENGIAEILPPGVRELAASVGHAHHDVASQLATFVPNELMYT